MAQTDCVVLPLADAAVIRAVRLAPASLAFLHGKTVIQMGTIAQEESLALQAEIERVGGSYCEAPVLERTIAQGAWRLRLFHQLRGRLPDSKASPSLHKFVAGSRVR